MKTFGADCGRAGIALMLLLALAMACSKPPLASDALWTGQPLAVDDDRAIAMLVGHLERADASRALRGFARVSLDGPDFKLNRPQRIAIERPSQLRFEVLGLFDVLAAMLVSDGREFGFYDASTPGITRGAVTPELLWQLAHLDLEVDEVVGLLLASPLPSPGMSVAGVWLEPDAGVTVAFAYSDANSDANSETYSASEAGTTPFASHSSLLDLDEGGAVFRFDAAGLLREMRSLEEGLRTRYRASFEDYTDLGQAANGQFFPMRITLESPQVDAHARFDWKRVVLTDELPARLFTIPQGLGTGS